MIYRWRGTVDNNWDTSGNWINEAGIAYTSGYPGDTSGRDDVVFYDASVTGANAPAGYDASTDEPLRKLQITAGFDGTLASSGTPLVIGAQQVEIDGSAASGIYISGAASEKQLDSVTVVGGPASGVISIGQHINTLRVLKGTVEVPSGSALHTLDVGYISNALYDSTVRIYSLASPIINATIRGGQTQCLGDVGSLIITGGLFTSAADVTTLRMYGGTYDWAQGKLQAVTILSGLLSAVNAAAPLFCTHPIALYPGGSIDLGSADVHLLQGVTFAGQGDTPAIRFPSGWAIRRERSDISTGSYALSGLEPMFISPDETYYTNAVQAMPGDELVLYGLRGDGNVTLTVFMQQDSASDFSVDPDEYAIRTYPSGDEDKLYVDHVELYGYDSSKPYKRFKIVSGSSGTSVHAAWVMVKRSP